MTPEEAIKSMQNLKLVLSITDSERSSVNTAIAALEKQIPKKPNITLRGTTGWNTESHCPVCKTMVHSGYCSGCGQAIDWEK